MMLTNAKTANIFLRGTIFRPTRSKVASSNGELIEKLINASQKQLTETAVLRRFLYEDPSKVQGFLVGGLSDGRLSAFNSASKFDERVKGRVVDEQDDDDDVIIDYDDDEDDDDELFNLSESDEDSESEDDDD